MSEYIPQRPSAVARREREEFAARVFGGLTITLVVISVAIASLVVNSPGYERLIEAIGSL